MYYELNTQFTTTQESFEKAKPKDLLPVVCCICDTTFYLTKQQCKIAYNKSKFKKFYCSRSCTGKSKTTTIEVDCKNCDKTFLKNAFEISRSKNHFCSRSCSTTYHNKNKTHGIRRSKLEKYLEKQFAFLYPDLEILYANKQVIGAELDIYIPSLKLAFEIQGIFHYKPIYGQAKLESIQKNDLEKIKKCKESNINLIHIDVSKQSKVNPNTSNEYLKEICNIIESNRLLRT